MAESAPLDDIADVVRAYVHAKQLKARAEATLRNCEQHIWDRMGSAEVGTIDNTPALYRKDTVDTKFDRYLWEIDHPDQVDRYRTVKRIRQLKIHGAFPDRLR